MMNAYYSSTRMYTNLYGDEDLGGRYGIESDSCELVGVSRRTLYTSAMMRRTVMQGVTTLGLFLPFQFTALY